MDAHSVLRLAFRAIFITRDDDEHDRAFWCAASREAQLQAEREVCDELKVMRQATVCGSMLTRDDVLQAGIILR